MPTQIMVIDNDKNMRKLFVSMLTHVGWQISTAQYAEANVALVQQFSPDLIILDFNQRQQGVDWQFLQLLKMDDATATIPVLVCTTTTTLSLDIAGYLAGRNILVVYKPFDAASLVLAIQQILAATSQIEVLSSDRLPVPILVVEDNPDIRDNIVQVLALEGYLVVAVANGQLALDTVTQIQPRLILLDINMPVMDGREFMAAYDRQPPPHSPVIILSAQTGLLHDEILPSFVIAKVAKPFHFHELLQLVKKHMHLA